MRRFIVLLAVFGCSTFTLPAQEPMVWVQRTDVGSPGFYEGAAMAFDAQQGVLLHFGGDKGVSGVSLAVPSADLWQYDGTVWQQVTVSGPLPPPHAAITCSSTIR